MLLVVVCRIQYKYTGYSKIVHRFDLGDKKWTLKIAVIFLGAIPVLVAVTLFFSYFEGCTVDSVIRGFFIVVRCVALHKVVIEGLRSGIKTL